ncbi:MAG: S1/P1 nuclease, partial [bacterium]
KGYLESKKDPKGDLVRAILFYEDLLRDKKSAKEDKEIALKFLVHMIGDVHQPLHVGTKNDMGANKVWVKWFDESTNLHKLWDEGLIEFQKLSYTEYVSFIDKIGESQQRDWNKTSLLDWVEESRIISDKLHEGLRVYKKHRLSYTYNYEYLELLNERLKQAGVRLAFFLNNIFDGRKNVDSDKIRETLGSEPNYGLPGRSK